MNSASSNNITNDQFAVKVGLSRMLKGGVIMDVMNVEQAKIAEKSGACAVMALEKIPADLRMQNSIARASDPKMIKSIMDSVTVPVMAKCRIGHFVEAQVLETLGVDFIDESEVLTVADDEFHIDKHPFKVPFVCGCRDLGEALRRVHEGAALLRSKGEAGTGNVKHAVKHLRSIKRQIEAVKLMTDSEIVSYAKEIRVPELLVRNVKQDGVLPVPLFAAGGVATPADCALMMQLGAETVFVGSGIFKSGDPEKRARAMVKAATHYNNPSIIAEVSEDLGEAMVGISDDKLSQIWSTKESMLLK